MIYTHVVRCEEKTIVSPLDSLGKPSSQGRDANRGPGNRVLDGPAAGERDAAAIAREPERDADCLSTGPTERGWLRRLVEALSAPIRRVEPRPPSRRSTTSGSRSSRAA